MSNTARDDERMSDKVASRLKLLRQDRADNKDNLCSLEISTQRFEVINYSVFGVAIFTEQPTPFSAEGIAANFLIGSTVASSLRIKHVRTTQVDKGYIVAFEITSEPLDKVRVDSIIEAKSIVEGFAQNRNELTRIPEEFRAAAYELKQMLSEVRDSIEENRNSKTFSSNEDLIKWENAFVEVVSEYLNATMGPSYARISEILKPCSAAEKKLAFDFFRAQLHELIYQSPFTHRTYTKPLGYAGDYEMMNIIYRNENVATTLFGKCLHRYFLDYQESQAVRNRATYLDRKIRALVSSKTKPNGRPYRILSVASGPAMEIQRLLTSKVKFDFDNVEFHLLDQDATALRHAQFKIRELSRLHGKSPNVNYIHKSIKHVIVGAIKDDFDLIYAAGLFDYFSDPVAQMAGESLFKQVSSGGQLVIGNFDISSPNQFVMELAVDWNLIYRSSDDLRRLFSHLAPNMTIESEEQGVNLFSVIEKK